MSKRIDETAVRYSDLLLAEVLDHAEVEGQEAFVTDAFTDLILDDLEQDGRWPDYQLARVDQRGARVDAWGLDEDRRVLHLAVADFDRTSTALTLSSSESTRHLKRLSGFFEKARKGLLKVPEHSPAGSLLDVIADHDRYDSVRLFLLTHRVAANLDVPDSEVDGVGCSTRIWDLETIRRFRETGTRLDPIDIDLQSKFGEGLPYLDGSGGAGVQTYLLFVPARHLAALYQEHGGRLLERNVRAFLSARGKINRGIRDTLRREPERFLAYNNGLTATAAAVRVGNEDGRRVIAGISDLQIVNGGQTTASIGVAARDPEANLDEVSVQMKLVVVEEDLLDEMVPNISRFANRQNAVGESDLSANHEYLRRLQEASRTEWTPAAASGRPTKWYFERARGSYGVDLMEAGPQSAQKRFTSEYPRGQKFGKNELALYENTWARLPHLVCRGGQKNFVEFMMRLPEPPADATEAGLDQWHRERFRRLIAKALLFKRADRAINSHYGGTYKRAVVTYAISYILERSKQQPDLARIWRNQQIPHDLETAIVEVAGPLKDELIESAMGRNITEWAKQEVCWKTLRTTDFPFSEISGSEPKTLSPRASSDAVGATGRGEPLSVVIERVHGEAIEGRYRRYRRRKWRHVGDTGVQATGDSTLHAYSAPMRSTEGDDYVFTVVVDFPAREIIPLGHLDAQRAKLVGAWIQAHGFPG